MNVYRICGDLPMAVGRGSTSVRGRRSAASYSITEGKGGGRRFAARAVFLRRVRLGARSARVSQQSLATRHGVVRLRCHRARLRRATPSGRPRNPLRNTREPCRNSAHRGGSAKLSCPAVAGRPPGRTAGAGGRLRAPRPPPPSFPRCGSKRRAEPPTPRGWLDRRAPYRIRAPNALAASSTASAAVAFSRSRIGLTSTISNEPSRRDSATSSIARCASR
jgi:hypothetical protein